MSTTTFRIVFALMMAPLVVNGYWAITDPEFSTAGKVGVIFAATVFGVWWLAYGRKTRNPDPDPGRESGG